MPSLETLERFANALEVPLHRLFSNGQENVATAQPTPTRSLEELADETGPSGTEARVLLKLKPLVGQMTESDRTFLLDFARRLCPSGAREADASNGRQLRVTRTQSRPAESSSVRSSVA